MSTSWCAASGDGGDLVISRDYIAHGLRSRAGDLVAAELGPKPEHEIRAALAREVEAERWTGLDAAIRMAAGETGLIDLRPGHAGEGHPGADDPQARRLATARLAKLERLGLAAASGPGQWVVSPQAEPVLRDLGMRGDIIKTMHRAFAARGYERAAADYVVDEGAAPGAIVGRLIATGLHDELSGEAFAVIDGTDGRAHHVRLRGVEVLADAPPRGGIVEVRRFGGVDDPRPRCARRWTRGQGGSPEGKGRRRRRRDPGGRDWDALRTGSGRRVRRRHLTEAPHADLGRDVSASPSRKAGSSGP